MNSRKRRTFVGVLVLFQLVSLSAVCDSSELQLAGMARIHCLPPDQDKAIP
ncbi:hypothetical protein [Paenibacillus sp. SI8]|uniref:hypothetical protein n=1 Tax=unclassified Paenibacillus TaxID=185978 RepID=UPI003466843F